MSFYAVAHGFAPGIYTKWDDAKKNVSVSLFLLEYRFMLCSIQIDDFPQPVYKKFSTEKDAQSYLDERRPSTVHGICFLLVVSILFRFANGYGGLEGILRCC